MRRPFIVSRKQDLDEVEETVYCVLPNLHISAAPELRPEREQLKIVHDGPRQNAV
jgi:hypothetical protein